MGDDSIYSERASTTTFEGLDDSLDRPPSKVVELRADHRHCRCAFLVSPRDALIDLRVVLK